MRRVLLPALAVLLVAAVFFGLRQASEDTGRTAVEPGSAQKFDLAEARQRLRGAPPPLAALHAEANRNLDGGPRAFRRRLAALKGHPVVVNKWAWWCGPCRLEAPYLQEAAVRYGRRVAFVGVDVDYSRSDAAKFHETYPLPFPSYWDPESEVTDALADIVGARLPFTPTTVFIDRSGKLAYLSQGDYTSTATLSADIERYLKP